MFDAAIRDGYYLVSVSGYRSYNRQYQIFTNYLITMGKEHTLVYSAVPSTSEHQTGLSIDITSEALHDRLDTCFVNARLILNCRILNDKKMFPFTEKQLTIENEICEK